MSESQHFEVKLEAPGFQLPVYSCDVNEALSSPGGARVVVEDPDDAFEPEALVDTDASIVFLLHGEEKRRFSMRVASARWVDAEKGIARHVLTLHPRFWFLGLGRGVRKWRDRTTEAIISTVLGENGVAHAFRTTRACASRPWTVQYRESDRAFVSRLLEYEGIAYHFEDDGTMVMTDRSSAGLPVVDWPVVRLYDATGALQHADRGLTSIAKGMRVRPGKATVNDYDWKKPSTSLIASSAGPVDADLEIYDFPTGYRDAATGEMLAKLRREALEHDRTFARGTGTVPTFAASRLFELQQEGSMTFGGEWLLTRIDHHYSAATKARPAQYSNSFEAIPSAVPFRPRLETPRPIVSGNHTAMVRGPVGEEIHTDVFGRAKVQFHWDREAVGTDADSRWIRVLQETSTSMALARVGWEVLVSYIDGDPERPIAIARNINGEMVPTYAQPSSKNVMTIKTETYPGKAGFNELKMDDSVGTMRIDVKAERDLENYVQNDKTETIGNNETHVVTLDFTRNVAKTQTVVIGANETITIAKDSKLKTDANRTTTIGGNETIKVGATTAANVAGNDTEIVGGVRRTMTGSFEIPIPKPADLLKSLVPSASSVAGAVGGAVGGPVVGGAAAALAGGASPREALAGAARQVGENLRNGLAGGPSGSPGRPGGAGGPSGPGGPNGPGGPVGPSGPGGPGETTGPGAPDGRGRDGGSGGAPGGMPGGMPGSMPGGIGAQLASAFSLPSGAPDVGGALKSLVPSPSSILSKATGGLSDVRSIGDLTKFLKGSIRRTAGKRMVRSVGGAYVAVAGGSVTQSATKLMVETIGGVKLSLSGKENIGQTVSGNMLRAVGALTSWKAKGDINVASNTSSVTVGGSAKFDAGDKMEMRSGTIEIIAAQNLKLVSGKLLIDMVPGAVTIEGDLDLKSETDIRVSGGPDDLTAGG